MEELHAKADSRYKPSDSSDNGPARARSASGSIVPAQRKPSSGLLTKWPFFNPGSSEPGHDLDQQLQAPTAAAPESLALASALAAHTQGRRRTSSLRKSAILGPGGKSPTAKSNTSEDQVRKATQFASPTTVAKDRERDREVTTADRRAPVTTTSPTGKVNHATFPPAKQPDILREGGQYRSLASPSSTTPFRDASHRDTSVPGDARPHLRLTGTTQQPLPLQSTRMPLSPSPPSSESSLASPHRRRSGRIISPLTTAAIAPANSLDGQSWDYSETEWWGYIILVVTWVVFVVGMGSCLGVWSWAWDVGETPYAPPELEDDPTLPIVGYYPALMVLTAVMSWVWVVIAWIGMKYFKHATMPGEDL